jgi:hypothetical protein
MPRPRLLLCVLLAGCSVTRNTNPQPPPSAVRTTLDDTIRAVAVRRLAGDGWRATVTDIARSGQSADNPDEVWQESVWVVTFVAHGPDGTPRLLRQPEMAAVLRGMQSSVWGLVWGAGGDVQDPAEGEGFRERWVFCPYKLTGAAGWARITLGPLTGKDEETVSRLELVIRELPAK